MDSKKIGAFIASKRKEKQMTQKQLGEALDCSDKLISKWECGNGLPDVSMILPLCEQLEINVNELLSGESLTRESYPGKAEENMMNLIKTNEHQKKGHYKENGFRFCVNRRNWMAVVPFIYGKCLSDFFCELSGWRWFVGNVCDFSAVPVVRRTIEGF